MMYQRKWSLWLVITILWMALIFWQSSMPYQRQDIRPVLAAHLHLNQMEIPHVDFHYDHEHVTWAKPYNMIEFFIRKGGHVFEYAILTFLWIQTLLTTSLRRSSVFLLGIVLSLLYAGTDEWHQWFVIGRTGHLIDVVGPDLAGMLFMALICFLLGNGRKRGKSITHIGITGR